MFNFDNISIKISVEWYYLLIFAVVLLLYTFYIYKYTLPIVSKTKKWFLIFLRSLILILITILFFEPTLIVKKNITVEPVNLVFVDNSQSIVSKDSLSRANSIKNFLKTLSTDKNNPVFFTFGQAIKKINPDSLRNINFNDPATNFNLIYNFLINYNKPFSSVTIISDGQINEGENPLNKFEKFNVPFFTIGVGDTTIKKDLSISKILYNDYIYRKKPTTIKVVVTNKNYGNIRINVSFKENFRTVSSKKIEFKNEAVKNIEFEYIPQKAGERKLSFEISKLPGEDNYENNRKTVYVNVLKSKIKVLLVSASPSPDVSFVKNSLENNIDIELKSIIQITRDKFFPEINFDEAVDSSDVLFLIGFPGKQTPDRILNKIKSAINIRHKPYFFSFSAGTDFANLQKLNNVLNFNITNFTDQSVPAQIQITDENHPLFKFSSADYLQIWNSLPPVDLNNSDFTLKANAKILAGVKINNIPLNKPVIIAGITGNNKSVSLLAKNFWKWKLQTADKNIFLFDSFLLNVVKWLRTDIKSKRFKLHTNKKFYSLGEKVIFTAQLYDETLAPLDDASISVKINKNGAVTEILLNSVGNGIYESVFEPNESGDYSYKAEAKLKNKTIATAKGVFNIGDVNLELTETNLNSEYLSLIAYTTGGKYFHLVKNLNINDLLEKVLENNLIYKTEFNEIKIWSNHWILIILILLFAVEWLIRKITGML